MLTKVQKLSDIALNKQYLHTDSSNSLSEIIRTSVIIVVQQVCFPIQSTLFDDPHHTCFLVTLVCDTPELGFISCSSCSQTIVKPTGFLKSESAWNYWELSQRVRILETVMGDILEEFLAKLEHVRLMNIQ